MAQSPLEILQKMGSFQQDGPNGPAQLRGLQGQYRDEARSRFRAAQGAGAPQGQLARLGGIADDYQSDMDESPLAAQQAQTDNFNTQNYQAASQGFGSSDPTNDASKGSNPLQSREIYRRGIEQEKLRQPVQLENIKQAGDLAQQKEQSRGLIGQQEVIANAKSQGFDALQQMMNSPNGGLKPGQRVAIPGIGSFNVPGYESAPNGAFQAINKARLEYEYAKKNKPESFNVFGTDETGPRKKSLDDAVLGYFGQYPTSPNVRNFATQIYMDPKTEDLSTDDILHMINTTGQYEQEDLDTLAEMLQTAKGK